MNRTTNKRIEKSSDKFIALTVNTLMIVIIMATILSSLTQLAMGIPQGPSILYNNTLNITPKPAAQITTLGGSFTTLVLNATTQTPRWKAYVGNVTGKLALDDANSKSIFDWKLASVTGEVYATRNSTIEWSSISCANQATILNEDSSLNMSTNNPDTINNTFVNKVHKLFYVGSIKIQNSTCPAIATYVNGTSQVTSENASFQEILLMDSSSSLVYATLINQNTTGFNNQKYDFQMIVAENEFQTNPTTYYLYVELI